MAPSSASEPNSNLAEKSWHLLSLLLRIGHPVPPQHLASICTLFPASPDFVFHVTSIPHSPIFLSDNGLVTPSAAAVCALGRFFSVAINRRFVSRGIRFRDPPERFCPVLRKRRAAEDVDAVELVPAAKRRLFFSCGEGGTDPKRLIISDGVPEITLESNAGHAEDMMRRNFPTMQPVSQYTHCENAINPLCIEDTDGQSSACPSLNFDCKEAGNDAITSMFQGEISGNVIKASDSVFMTGNGLTCQKVVGTDKFMQCNLFVNLALPSNFQDTTLCNDAILASSGLGTKKDHFDTLRHEYPESNCHPVDDICKSNAVNDPIRESHNEDKDLGVECVSKKRVIGSGTEKEKGDDSQKGNLAPYGEELKNDVEAKNRMPPLNLDKAETRRNIGTSSTAKQLLKSSCILKGEQKSDLQPKLQVLTESLACNIADKAPKNFDNCKNDQKIIVRHKLKQNRKENIAETASMTPKAERKAYPSFDTFMIEEEEGSGGYGTVYRARRKTDGKRLAIKCPHNNAHKNHINNERNMLERFGGKNFIIKFEGSFKSGSSDCFVLEHVEHDRPEVLKKEIEIIQLQWYGYCLFRALACLHKEGVVHRDIKPGNFLFSRKLNKGYLIDFNLAMDLRQKFNFGSKSKTGLGATSNIPLPSGSGPLIHDKYLGGSKSLTSNKRELADYKKNPELNRHVKQKACGGPLKPDKAGASLLRAQGTDGSGITSAKDVTSTRTVSAERLREPLPFKGRKELISLVQNTMQCASNSMIKGPSSQRKRVTAPSGKVDGKLIYLSPMPLHSSNVAAGLLRSKGDGKLKREGSCVGTKGFRAPEVLLRSQFQGPKVDIWSAGVTLLYMVIGKPPFTGDPEQNIKEIAKLRGSEELWEVAKLHDRELSFPMELLDERYLQSWNIESWCKYHTKRPEFLEYIPKSLYDLIDKCLTVNPRNRISVEEALTHEFFASCNELLRKQRMIRRGLSSDPAASTST